MPTATEKAAVQLASQKIANAELDSRYRSVPPLKDGWYDFNEGLHSGAFMCWSDYILDPSVNAEDIPELDQRSVNELRVGELCRVVELPCGLGLTRLGALVMVIVHDSVCFYSISSVHRFKSTSNRMALAHLVNDCPGVSNTELFFNAALVQLWNVFSIHRRVYTRM